MPRADVSRYQTFPEITERLDEIVSQVRDRDVSLERSLDLFDEAIVLGSKAVSLVDATDFSPEEEARLAEPLSSDDGASDDAREEGADAAASDGASREEPPSTPDADVSAASGEAESDESSSQG